MSEHTAEEVLRLSVKQIPLSRYKGEWFIIDHFLCIIYFYFYCSGSRVERFRVGDSIVLERAGADAGAE